MTVVPSLEENEFVKSAMELSRGKSIPYYFYTSPSIFELEMERIFYRKWLLICHSSELPRIGDVRTLQIGKKSIIVAKSEDGSFMAFHNVCPHRGTRLLGATEKHAKIIQCQYHGWTFKLDGSLVGCPDMDHDPSFDKAYYPLYPIKLELWGGFIWINLDPSSVPLASHLGDFCERFAGYKIEDFEWDEQIGAYEMNANWKTFAENSNECYHCPLVHPETFGKNYREHVPFDEAKIHGSYAMLSVPNLSSKIYKDNYELNEEVLSRLWLPWVFPNTQFVIGPEYIATLQVWPKTVNKSVLEAQIYFPKSGKPSDSGDLVKLLDMVNKQDLKIVESVQDGLSTEVFRGGRFSDLESAVRHYQRMYLNSLRQV